MTLAIIGLVVLAWIVLVLVAAPRARPAPPQVDATDAPQAQSPPAKPHPRDAPRRHPEYPRRSKWVDQSRVGNWWSGGE